MNVPVAILRDEKNKLIVIEIAGRAAVTMTLAAWSLAIAHPRRIVREPTVPAPNMLA